LKEFNIQERVLDDGMNEVLQPYDVLNKIVQYAWSIREQILVIGWLE